MKEYLQRLWWVLLFLFSALVAEFVLPIIGEDMGIVWDVTTFMPTLGCIAWFMGIPLFIRFILINRALSSGVSRFVTFLFAAVYLLTMVSIVDSYKPSFIVYLGVLTCYRTLFFQKKSPRNHNKIIQNQKAPTPNDMGSLLVGTAHENGVESTQTAAREHTISSERTDASGGVEAEQHSNPDPLAAYRPK